MDEKKTHNWEKRIEKQTKELWNNHRVLLFVFLLVGPFAFQLFTNVINIFAALNDWPIKFPSPGEWVGFWGSYLGVIPSGLIAYVVAKVQIDYQKKVEEKRREQDKKIDNLEKLEKCLRRLQPWVTSVKLLNEMMKITGEFDKETYYSIYRRIGNGVEYENDVFVEINLLSNRLKNDEEIKSLGLSFAEIYAHFFIYLNLLNGSFEVENSKLIFGNDEFSELVSYTKRVGKSYESLIEIIEDQFITAN